MKHLAAIVLLLSALPGMAAEGSTDFTSNDMYDETHQNNSSYNSPSSSMSNVQINPWGNARDYYGDGISCSKPSVNVGLAGGESPHRTMAYASINFPLGGGDCKQMAKTRKHTIEYQLHSMKAEQRKADVLFSAKMANMCLEISSHITITPDNALFAECSQYVALEPAPGELAELSVMWQRYGLRQEEIVHRVERIEAVAHEPRSTTLLGLPTGMIPTRIPGGR